MPTLYIWGKYNIASKVTSYKDTLVTSVPNVKIDATEKWDAGQSYTFNSSNGRYTITDSVEVSTPQLGSYLYFRSAKTATRNNPTHVNKRLKSPTNNGDGTYTMTYQTYERRAVYTYYKGSFIEEITSTDESSYPMDGQHSDGYWYVYIGAKITVGFLNKGGILRELTNEGYINKKGVLLPLTQSNMSIGGVLKSLLVGKPVLRLPDGYTELQYIAAAGSQYIDTEYIPSQASRIIMDFSLDELPTTNNSKYIFGARTATSKNSFALMLNYSTNQYIVHYADTNNDSGINGLGRHSIDMNGNVYTIDSVTKTFTAATFSSGCTLYLGTLNTNGTTFANGLIGKIYSCQIYDNGTLIRDFVPCTNPSGIVGMYDLVNDTFYTNSGSNSFTAGVAV